MTAIVTEHAFERMKERCGWNAVAAQRMAQEALDNGIPHAETAGRLKRQMDRLYMQHHTANNLRIFSNFVFVFNKAVLITVMHLDRVHHLAVMKIRLKRGKEQGGHET